MAEIFVAHGRTGGTTGMLDAIDGNDVADKDMAVVIEGPSGAAFFYHLDADSGAAESDPDVIAPDSNAGTKRWILQVAGNATYAA